MQDRAAVERVLELMDDATGVYPQSDVNVITTILSDMSQKFATTIVQLLTKK